MSLLTCFARVDGQMYELTSQLYGTKRDEEIRAEMVTEAEKFEQQHGVKVKWHEGDNMPPELASAVLEQTKGTQT